MTSTYRRNHRLARLGNLGTLACSLPRGEYQWFLTEVYDLRFPHVGDERHLKVRTFDSLRRLPALLYGHPSKRRQQERRAP